jgi:hypothetical protein
MKGKHPLRRQVNRSVDREAFVVGRVCSRRVAGAGPDGVRVHAHRALTTIGEAIADAPLRDLVAAQEAVRDCVGEPDRLQVRLRGQLRTALGVREDERRALAKALRSKEVQVAMRGEPALKRDVEAVRKAVDDEETAAKQRLAGVERARTEWLAEIDGLKTLLEQ